ncbi:MAG: acylphosphatase [Bacillota bacterium]|nr:acylphosphatase [Bacillota bacterium]MDW7676459.1 acylphosphatase [Bacillota bacterium]
MTAVLVRITGVVQGVSFRYHIKEKASAFHLKGWVRNRIDGSVEVFFQGSDDAVQKVVDWCHTGPPMAAVESVEISPMMPDQLLSGFRVRSTC